MKEYWDKDYYEIIGYGTEKDIHFFGYFYCCGEDNGEGECREVEYCGFECPLNEFLEWRNDPDEYDIRQESCKQYIGDCTEKEAIEMMNTFYGGKPPIELSLDDITMDTPCGYYVDV